MWIIFDESCLDVTNYFIFSALISLRNRSLAEKAAREKLEAERLANMSVASNLQDPLGSGDGPHITGVTTTKDEGTEALTVAREVIDDLLSRLAPETGFICQSTRDADPSSEDTCSEKSSDTEVSESDSIRGNLKKSELLPTHAGMDKPEEDKPTTSSLTVDEADSVESSSSAPPPMITTAREEEPLQISPAFYEQQLEKMEKDLGATSSLTSSSNFDLYLTTLENTLEELNQIESEKMRKIADRMERVRRKLLSESSEGNAGSEEEDDFLSASSYEGSAEEAEDEGDEDEENSFKTANNSLNLNDLVSYSAPIQQPQIAPVDPDNNNGSGSISIEDQYEEDRLLPPELEEDIRTILRHDLAAIEAINMDQIMESLPRAEDPDSLIINDIGGNI